MEKFTETINDIIWLALIIVGIFMIAFGNSGEEWQHYGSFWGGITVTVLSGLRILTT